jgi:hypothetical protein
VCGLRLPAGTACDVVLDFVREEEDVRLGEVTDAARTAGVSEVAEVVKTAEERVAV